MWFTKGDLESYQVLTTWYAIPSNKQFLQNCNLFRSVQCPPYIRALSNETRHFFHQNVKESKTNTFWDSHPQRFTCHSEAAEEARVSASSGSSAQKHHVLEADTMWSLSWSILLQRKPMGYNQPAGYWSRPQSIVASSIGTTGRSVLAFIPAKELVPGYVEGLRFIF